MSCLKSWQILNIPLRWAGEAEEKPGLLKLLVDNCLKNVYVWLFAISYFFVYVVRQGVTSWFIFYLRVSKPGIVAQCSTCSHLNPLNPCVHLDC